MTETIEPNADQLIQWLLELLDVQGITGDQFVGRRKRGGVGRVFGGQVLAQALVAAQRTVPVERTAHSLHAYFLRGGNENSEIKYQVQDNFDRLDSSNRQVVARQAGLPILTLTASFNSEEGGSSHQDAQMPDVPMPEALEPESLVRQRYAYQLPDQIRPQFLAPRPIELRAVEGRHWGSATPSEPVAHTWFRAVSRLPEDQAIHQAVLTYASDMSLLGTCLLPHGLSWSRGEIKSASLDHAIWFHGPVLADEWLLYATESPHSGGGRGFNWGRVFNREGRLVASVAQEGMIRRTTNSLIRSNVSSASQDS